MENSLTTKTYSEKDIEKIFKIIGTEIEELDNNEIVITEQDCSVIDIDIIISY